MIDDGTRIIDKFLWVCKEVQPDLSEEGTITAVYKRTDFVDLFRTIGELYHTLVCFNMPTKYLTIDIKYPTVKITLDYKAIKVLLEMDEESEENEN